MSSKPTTLDHLKSKKHRTRRSVRIATDDASEERHREAKRQFDLATGRARRFPTDPTVQEAVSAAKQELAEAERDLADNSIKFTFEAIGYKSYDSLLEQHLITPERLQELSNDPRFKGTDVSEVTWDPDTFPIALISASLVEPEDIDKEELAAWLGSDDWNSTELQALFSAAMEANISTRVVQLGNV